MSRRPSFDTPTPSPEPGWSLDFAPFQRCSEEQFPFVRERGSQKRARELARDGLYSALGEPTPANGTKGNPSANQRFVEGFLRELEAATRKLLVTCSVLVLVPGIVLAQSKSRVDRPISGLGHVHIHTSCSPAVAPSFDRALALLHNFWYARALDAFTEVMQADPNCAMAYWGAAMTYNHPFWDAPTVLSSVFLREQTGHTGVEDIEIRALWTDGVDSLIFAGSSWGNDASRSPDLPAFFVLDVVPSETPPPLGSGVGQRSLAK